jgi:hypothetical protein
MKELFLRGTTSASTIAMIIWGSVDMTAFLFEKLRLPWALAGSCLILALVLASVLTLPAFALVRNLGARPFESPRIYVTYSRTTEIKADFSAIVENTRQIVFLKEPRGKDLWDAFAVMPGELLNNLACQHKTITVPPIKYNDKYFYSEFPCVGDVGVFTETIIPPFIPAEVVAFPRPRFKGFSSGEKIILYAIQKARKVDGLQPQISPDGNVLWRIAR